MTGWNNKENLLLLFLTIICASLIHLASNTFNDYYDFIHGSDNKDTKITPFSGGSGLIVDGKLSSREVLLISIVLTAAALVTGLGVLNVSPANPLIVMLLGLAGFLLGFCYTASPFKLVYRGLGEVVIFIAFGPLPVLTAFYILGGELSNLPLIASLPPGIMTCAILWINQFPDFETDAQAGKTNLLVRMGTERGRYVYYALVGVSAGVICLGTYFGQLPNGSIWALLYLAPSGAASLLLHKNYDDGQKLVPAMGLTVAAQSVMTVLMIVAVIFQ